MVILETHSKELYWLKRRIQFIKKYDALLEADADTDEVMAVVSQFNQVEKPSDLMERLKETYKTNELP